MKPLNTSLFGEIEEVSITELLNNGLITQQQIDGYKIFVEEDSIRLFKEIIRSVEYAEDFLEKLKIAQKRMSKVQHEFAVNRLAKYVRSRGN